MRFLSLFAGIGGFDLGLERAGHQCVGQVEIDPFCRRVLARHWPNVWRWDDVRTLTKELCDEHCGRIDFICGGFPCQDISNAGSMAGIAGERSGLWSEFRRIIWMVRPSFVAVENVAALLNRGINTVLGDLASEGFDAEWGVLGASDFGAPHIRERIFIIAHAKRMGWSPWGGVTGHKGQAWIGRCQPARSNQVLADADESDCAGVIGEWQQRAARSEAGSDWWAVEPDVDRVAYGVSARVDRIAALGNAVVPQVAEYIGRLLPVEA